MDNQSKEINRKQSEKRRTTSLKITYLMAVPVEDDAPPTAPAQIDGP